MELYPQIMEYFSSLPFSRDWALVQEVFAWRVSKQPPHWQLPGKACLAFGGSPEAAVPAGTALGCLQTAILIVDDLLDGDGRMARFETDPGRLANLASLFTAAGLLAVQHSGMSPEGKLLALESLQSMLAATSIGQYLDEQNPQDEAGYWRVAQLKSAPFFGTALQIGALAGGADREQAHSVYELGFLYGEMIQVQDDLHDAFKTPANADWAQGRSSLPILFAEYVPHPDRERFLELRRSFQEKDLKDLKEAQQILIRCGALSYCLDVLMKRDEQARRKMGGLNLPNPAPMETLFAEAVAPVKGLLRKNEANRA